MTYNLALAKVWSLKARAFFRMNCPGLALKAQAERHRHVNLARADRRRAAL